MRPRRLYAGQWHRQHLDCDGLDLRDQGQDVAPVILHQAFNQNRQPVLEGGLLREAQKRVAWERPTRGISEAESVEMSVTLNIQHRTIRGPGASACELWAILIYLNVPVRLSRLELHSPPSSLAKAAARASGSGTSA